MKLSDLKINDIIFLVCLFADLILNFIFDNIILDISTRVIIILMSFIQFYIYKNKEENRNLNKIFLLIGILSLISLLFTIITIIK